MKNIIVEIDPESIELSGNNITGVVIINAGAEVIFPELGWNDMICVVLTWWLRACRDFDNGSMRQQFRFMEGPLYYDLIREGDEVSLLLWHNEVMIERVDTIDFIEFEKSLIYSSRLLIRSCQNKGILSNELTGLKENLSTYLVAEK